MIDFDLSPLLEELERSRPYLHDALMITVSALLFYALGKLVRWIMRRRARRVVPGPEGEWGREMLFSTRRVLTPLMTLIGAYIAFRYVGRHHPERYHGSLAAEYLSGFLYVAILIFSLWFAIRVVKVWLGWYRIHLIGHAGGEGLARDVRPVILGAERVLKVLLITCAVIVALRHFKQDVSSLVVSLGIGSIAIGLAAQDTFANMLAGFLILMDRPFSLGDRIQLSTGELGDVIHIGFRSTQLRLGSGALLIVANRELAQARLTNLSTEEKKLRVSLEFCLPLDADDEALRAAAARAGADSASFADDPQVEVRLKGIDGARRYSISVWAHDARHRGEAVDLLGRRLLAEFAAAGLMIVPATREIWREIQDAAPRDVPGQR